MARLRTFGFSFQQVRGVLRHVRGIGNSPRGKGEFVVLLNRSGKPNESVKFCGTGEAIELMKKRRGQMILPLWTPDQGSTS